MDYDFIEKYEDLVYGELGICGCGYPEETIEMIVEYLKHDIEYTKKIKSTNYNYDAFLPIYEEKEKWQENFIEKNKEILFVFMLYMLNNKGFMEHGTSIYSSWVEEKGKKLIEYYERAKQENYEL